MKNNMIWLASPLFFLGVLQSLALMGMEGGWAVGTAIGLHFWVMVWTFVFAAQAKEGAPKDEIHGSKR